MKTFRIISACVGICAMLMCYTPSLTAQERVTSANAPALEKVRILPAQEHRADNTAVFTISAEEVGKIAPEFVQIRTENLPSPHARMPHLTQQKTVQSVDYTAMIPLLVKAMQEQQTEIERLRNEISTMKAQAQK